MSRLNLHRGRIASGSRRIATLSVAAALVAGGGGAALAFWTSTGTGTGAATTGTSTDFTVTSGAATGNPLTPGTDQSVPFTVTNVATSTQQLSSVDVTIADPDGTPWDNGAGCTFADYTVTVDTPLQPYGAIAASGTVDGTVTVTMLDAAGNQDACQGESVPLHFVAS
jgi:hypothetical protein